MDRYERMCLRQNDRGCLGATGTIKVKKKKSRVLWLSAGESAQNSPRGIYNVRLKHKHMGRLNPGTGYSVCERQHMHLMKKTDSLLFN